MIERPEHLADAEAKTGIDPVKALGIYALRLPIAREAARRYGYALGLHGSMRRDLDLIAAPWTEEAVPPEDLVKGIAVAVGGYVRKETRGCQERDETGATSKPHGRRAWVIHLGADAYIDLSVMPRVSKETKE